MNPYGDPGRGSCGRAFDAAAVGIGNWVATL